MEIKKFSDIFTIERLYKNREQRLCEICHVKKPIPKIREIKTCDDCIDEEIRRHEKEEKDKAMRRRLGEQRIPERYMDFDPAKLEVDDFESMCHPGFSYAILGEIGTGKTNLACQVLIARRTGYFYTANELTSKIVDRIYDEPLLAIDDLTEMDVTSEKKVEAIRTLFYHRYAQQMDTIITLSKSYHGEGSELERFFGDFGRALVSRFKQWMTPVVLKRKHR